MKDTMGRGMVRRTMCMIITSTSAVISYQITENSFKSKLENLMDEFIPPPGMRIPSYDISSPKV